MRIPGFFTTDCLHTWQKFYPIRAINIELVLKHIAPLTSPSYLLWWVNTATMAFCQSPLYCPYPPPQTPKNITQWIRIQGRGLVLLTLDQLHCGRHAPVHGTPHIGIGMKLMNPQVQVDSRCHQQHKQGRWVVHPRSRAWSGRWAIGISSYRLEEGVVTCFADEEAAYA